MFYQNEKKKHLIQKILFDQNEILFDQNEIDVNGIEINLNETEFYALFICNLIYV